MVLASTEGVEMGSEQRLIRQAVARRMALGKSQGGFWRMFGLSQPAASRLECSGRGSPSLIVLLRLYFAGCIDDNDLLHARVSACPVLRCDEVQLYGPGDRKPARRDV
ncbi:helix-turn-helix domain-containing protein [Pseudomonas syringae]|uniref:helix-turn-helix domain-containing protein n=2 Tax=Pseudomonas syringae TaxID=317 RepID=UPI003AF36834